MASSARSTCHSVATSGRRGRQRKSVHKLARMTSRCRFGAFVYTVGLLRCRGQTRGRNSVHKSPKMTSQCRFGAFVYTVALLWTDVGTQECTQMGGSGLSAPDWGVCVHCCDASRDTNRDSSCARRHERLNHHGVPAAPPRWPLPLGREDRLCASGAAARLASSPRRQPTRTPEEHTEMGQRTMALARKRLWWTGRGSNPGPWD